VYRTVSPGYVRGSLEKNHRRSNDLRNEILGVDGMTAEQGSTTGLSIRDPRVLLATWFGVGLLPKAPGTWGSLAALPFAWIIHQSLGKPGLVVAVVLLFLVGIWSAGYVSKHSATKDPGAIVIDEVAGQWLVLLPVHPDIILYGLGFVLFRVADILKPWPVSWADRTVRGGLGVMLDDLLAAVYAGAALFGLSHWIGGAG
jgi:phosphatidylglycerophosphatase A